MTVLSIQQFCGCAQIVGSLLPDFIQALTVTIYHSHSLLTKTFTTCRQRLRLNHLPTPLAMSIIKYHIKTAMPHTAVKLVAHFTSDFQNTGDSPKTQNHSHPPTYNILQQLHCTHHAHTRGHTIYFKSSHILSSLTKSSQLDLIEYAAVKIICPSLNKLHSAVSTQHQQPMDH